jgi:hypothetical protein
MVLVVHNHGARITFSCGFTHVIFQKPTEPFTTVYWACTPFVCSGRRKKQDIVFPLVISLVMIMGNIRCERMPESPLAK